MCGYAGRSQLVVHIFIAMVLTRLGATVTAEGAGGPVSVIPSPVACEPREGSFAISPSTCVVATGDATTEASKLVDLFAPEMAYADQPYGSAIRVLRAFLCPPASRMVQVLCCRCTSDNSA